MKKIFTLISIIISLNLHAQIGGGWDWAFNTGSLGGANYKHLKYSTDGTEILMGGSALAAAYFGSTTLTAATPCCNLPGNIKFFGKINVATGVPTIIRSFENFPVNFDCITTDDAGNFYIGGGNSTNVMVDFGNGVTIPGSTFKMGVIAKFDATGTALWAKTFGMGPIGSATNNILRLAVSNVGNIYFWGFNPTANPAGTAPFNKNYPLYKLDNDGNTIWYKDALNNSSLIGNVDKHIYLADKFIDNNENVNLFVFVASNTGFTFDGVTHPGGDVTYGGSTLISLNGAGTVTNALTFIGGVTHFQVNRTNGNLVFGWNQNAVNPAPFNNLPHPLGSISASYTNFFEGMVETDKNLNFIKAKDYFTTLDNPFQASVSNDKFLSLPNGKLLIAKNFDKTISYSAGVNSVYGADATKYATAIIETDTDWAMAKFITGGKTALSDQTYIAAKNDAYVVGAGFYAENVACCATASPPLPTTSFGSVNLIGFNAAANLTTAYGTYSTSSTFRYDVAVAQCKSGNFPTIASTSWLGGTTNWNTPSNWSNGVPTNGMKAVFDLPTTNYPTVSTTPTAATLQVNAGVTLPLPTTLTLVGGVKNEGTITINNAGFFQGLGASEWKGNGSVNFTGTTANFNYSKVFTNPLILNTDVTTFQNITIPTITFNTGKFNLNAKKLFITSPNTNAITGTGTANYFYGGSLQRNINPTGTYEFPVGSSSNFQSATITANNLVGVNNITTTYTNGAITGTTPSINYNSAVISSALNGGWYSINPDKQPTSGTYNSTLKITGSSNNAANAGMYTVIKRNNSTAAWAVQGNYNLATTSAGTVTATNTNLISFSDFAIGIGNSVLPIRLTDFTAKENFGNANLYWRTASEINNKGFNIQHSLDGINFTNIVFINGIGNSTINNDYYFTDYKPTIGKHFYRLQSIDFDGSSSLSSIRVVTISGEKNSIVVYPNPVASTLNFTNSNSISSIEIFDANGKSVKRYKQPQQNIDVSMLANGSYIAKLKLNSGEIFEKKFIIKK